jgi:hypothetical protein
MFDIEGVHNSQNDQVRAVNRTEAEDTVGIREKRKGTQLLVVMVWLGFRSEGVSPLVIFEHGTVNHACSTREVLVVAVKYGND